MPWVLRYIDDLKIVHTIYTQPVSLDELREAVAANAKLAAEKDTNLFLGDCSTFVQSGPTLGIYQLGTFIASMNDRFNIKEALVVPQEPSTVAEDFRFFKTVATNRSLNVRLFHDVESAIAWLLE